MNTKTVRIFSNYTLPNFTSLLGKHESEFTENGIKVFLNKSGRADLVIVLNGNRAIRWVLVPRGRVIKILQEPIINNFLTHMFTIYHSRIYDEILSHSPDPKDSRQIESLPYINFFVNPYTNFSEIIREKQLMLSVIASSLQILPGHKKRYEFVENLLLRFPELKQHSFGKGRDQVLTHKIDGLRRYRFSIAIENSSVGSYLTEKFTDCILAGCIPLYFGSPKTDMYFPKDSYISLPIDDFEECCRIVSDLSESDYQRRVPALIKAQKLVLNQYSLGALILDRVKSDTKPAMRLVFLLRIDGVVQNTFIVLMRIRNLFQKIKVVLLGVRDT